MEGFIGDVGVVLERLPYQGCGDDPLTDPMWSVALVVGDIPTLWSDEFDIISDDQFAEACADQGGCGSAGRSLACSSGIYEHGCERLHQIRNGR